jgi:hypothetical protein
VKVAYPHFISIEGSSVRLGYSRNIPQCVAVLGISRGLVSDRGDGCPFLFLFDRHLGFNSSSISAHSSPIISH